jgi:hypothetical protein
MPDPAANELPPTATLRPPCRELPLRRRRRVEQPIVINPKPRHRRSERGERMLTVVTLSDGRELLPMIRMRGRWLARLGFRRDARIVVSEEQGRIVLTLAGEE